MPVDFAESDRQLRFSFISGLDPQPTSSTPDQEQKENSDRSKTADDTVTGSADGISGQSKIADDTVTGSADGISGQSKTVDMDQVGFSLTSGMDTSQSSPFLKLTQEGNSGQSWMNNNTMTDSVDKNSGQNKMANKTQVKSFSSPMDIRPSFPVFIRELLGNSSQSKMADDTVAGSVAENKSPNIDSSLSEQQFSRVEAEFRRILAEVFIGHQRSLADLQRHAVTAEKDLKRIDKNVHALAKGIQQGNQKLIKRTEALMKRNDEEIVRHTHRITGVLNITINCLAIFGATCMLTIALLLPSTVRYVVFIVAVTLFFIVWNRPRE
jgi:hypothetical protein